MRVTQTPCFFTQHTFSPMLNCTQHNTHSHEHWTAFNHKWDGVSCWSILLIYLNWNKAAIKKSPASKWLSCQWAEMSGRFKFILPVGRNIRMSKDTRNLVPVDPRLVLQLWPAVVVPPAFQKVDLQVPVVLQLCYLKPYTEQGFRTLY